MHKSIFNGPLNLFCIDSHRARDRFDDLPFDEIDRAGRTVSYRNFISERSNADSGYIRIPITSQT